MSQHQYTYTPEAQESKIEGIIIAVACVAVFAFWGVLLALGVWTMNYFNTRYEALKAYPNAIVRKVLNHHVNARAGEYVVFNDYSTYDTWKRCGHVKWPCTV